MAVRHGGGEEKSWKGEKRREKEMKKDLLKNRKIVEKKVFFLFFFFRPSHDRRSLILNLPFPPPFHPKIQSIFNGNKYATKCTKCS